MESSTNSLKSILERIQSAQDVEQRVELISELKKLKLTEPDDLALLVRSLTTFWEDSTCLDISQCKLKKSILHVATALLDLEFNICGCLVQLLALGSKASKWCEKHLKMTLMSTEDSQEKEHCNFFFQLLLDLLNFSVAGLQAMEKNFILKDKDSTAIGEKYIVEQLNLTKIVISEFKKIGSLGSEALRISQLVITSAVRVCSLYSEALDSKANLIGHNKDLSSLHYDYADLTNDFISILKGTAEKLHELGILAAQGGGTLVAILNVSWKGLIQLLQLRTGAVAMKVNVADIILTLISLVNDSLKCAVEAWSYPLKEEISTTEAKKTCIPVKFYLINAGKVASLYPSQAYLVYREIVYSILTIHAFQISLSNEKLLKTASEMLAEILDQTSLKLLYPLLNSDMKQECKSEILDWLFTNEDSIQGDASNICKASSMEEILSVSSDGMPGLRKVLLTRFAVFISLLRNSFELEDDVELEVAKKLRWLLDTLIEEDVYSYVFISQFPNINRSGTKTEVVWQPMYFHLVNALKTFMVVVSSSAAWAEMESFLLENLFHTHFLCWEIVVELLCFVVRHSKTDLVNLITNRLCSLLKLLASEDSVLLPGSAFRKLAKAICMILTCSPQSNVDYVLESIVGEEKLSSSVACMALFMEGFPLNLLSDGRRSTVQQKLISECVEFMEKFGNKSQEDSESGITGLPVFAMSALMHSLWVSISDVHVKILDFLVSTIQVYGNSVDNQMKEFYLKLVRETLSVTSNMECLFASDKMEELVLELQNLFISGRSTSDTDQLHICKPDLALFMAGFAHMKILDFDTCKKSFAVLELYHMLLKEKHWALIHLAATAFGYFAARTNCGELWKFIPPCAALSYDIESGNETSDESFMLEMKAFLDKNRALTMVVCCSEQFGVLIKEGLLLKEMVKKIPNFSIEISGGHDMETDGEVWCNKRRKLPDGIGKGMELLQSGLKVLEDSLLQWQQHPVDSTELHEKFFTHFTRLEDEIGCLSGLVGHKR